MTQDIIDLLIHNAETGSQNTKMAAIKALGEGAPKTTQVIDCLKNAVENGGSDIRCAALVALGRLFRNR
ncbi:TPA: hypothetical protein ACTW88_002139 [Raoultella ornithinolytica]